MTTEFDPKKSYLKFKSNEKMVAFASFLIDLKEFDIKKDAVLKISSFQRAFGGGRLTLTHIVDTRDNPAIKTELNSIFEELTEAAFKPFMGVEFEKLVKVSLDSLVEVKDWYIEEINVHFRSLKDREKALIERAIIPALEHILPFKFDAIEWWPENQEKRAPSNEDIEEEHSLKGLFRKWFGG